MIKAYTDLEQSKRLAKILPIETADFCWGIDDDTLEYNCAPWPTPWATHTARQYYIPCWSLAALFDTLPKTIGDYSKMMGYFDDAYHCDYLDEDGESLGNGTTADTLIDAVYEMLLKQNTPK